MFNALVPEYDLFNRLSSLGLDVQWRREAVRSFERPGHILDVGTGTGDMARELLSAGHEVMGVDFSDRMVNAARSKLDGAGRARFEVASSDQLPFDNETFDGVTSAFVIRNLHHGGVLTQSLREFQRVLKPGGLMVHLELTRPPSGMLLWGYKTYMSTILPSLGWVVFGKRWPKNYLNKTIENLPAPRTLCQWMRWSGFEQVRHYPLNGGIASLFMGTKC